MNKVPKMNVCYLLGFIFLMVCIPLLICALVFAYLLKLEFVGVIFASSGVLLAFAGIILVLCSKPKKAKPPKAKIPKDIDMDF